MEDPGEKISGKEADQQIRLAMRALLAERFHFESHFETRLLPAYTLVVAKGGFKLKPAAPAEGSSSSTGRGRMTSTNASMERLASLLAAMLDRPVVDKVLDTIDEQISPVADLRGSEWYKRRMARVFVKKALDQLNGHG